MEVIFKKCGLCGNIVQMVEQKGPPVVCCGKPMEQLIPGTVDASVEKHVPAVTWNGDVLEVQVGSVIHPMTAEHYIAFIYVQTDKGGVMKFLEIDAEPTAKFRFADEKPVAVFEYCNLHGLWKTDI